MSAATATRVAGHTAAGTQRRLRERDDARIALLAEAEPAALDARLAETGREWDVERTLQANAALASLAALAAVRRRRTPWLLAPAVIYGFLLQHALSGWCPPLAVLRRLGVRTEGEIQRERHALKALRGDYDAVPPRGSAPAAARVRAVLVAVDRA